MDPLCGAPSGCVRLSRALRCPPALGGLVLSGSRLRGPLNEAPRDSAHKHECDDTEDESRQHDENDESEQPGHCMVPSAPERGLLLRVRSACAAEVDGLTQVEIVKPPEPVRAVGGREGRPTSEPGLGQRGLFMERRCTGRTRTRGHPHQHSRSPFGAVAYVLTRGSGRDQPSRDAAAGERSSDASGTKS